MGVIKTLLSGGVNMWDLFIILLALGLLMFAAYRGFSVILFAPLCALLAVFLIDPGQRFTVSFPVCSWKKWLALFKAISQSFY